MKIHGPLQTDLLRLLADGLLSVAEGALARIWLISPGDVCESCPMRAECPDQTQCLHLVRSAGLSASTDGPFRRFPLGARQVGSVPLTQETCVINDDLAALGLADGAWLMAHDIRSFAATPLAADGTCLGVAAVFARVPLDAKRMRAVEAIAAIAGRALAAAPDAAVAPVAAVVPRAPKPAPTPAGTSDLPILRAWDDIERDVLERVLDHTAGRVSGPRGAAALLDLKPTTLQSRLKKLGVRRKRV